MKRLLMTAAALALLSTTAHATQTNLVKSGVWSTDLHENNGRRMCVMTNVMVPPDKAVKLTMFKLTVETCLFMHIAKSNWSIPADAKIPLGVAFDNGVRQATGFVAENQHDMIEVPQTMPQLNARAIPQVDV